MNLQDFLKTLKEGQGDRSLNEYAKFLGLDRGGLWRIMNGKTKPSIETFLKCQEKLKKTP